MVCVGRQRTREVGQQQQSSAKAQHRSYLGRPPRSSFSTPFSALPCFHGPSAGRATLHRSSATLLADEPITLSGANYRNKHPSASTLPCSVWGKPGREPGFLTDSWLSATAAPSFWGAGVFSFAYKYHRLLHLDPGSPPREVKDWHPVWWGPFPVPTSRLSALSGSQTWTTRLEMPDILKSDSNMRKPGQGKKHRRATIPEQKPTPSPTKASPAICICPTRLRPVVSSIIPLVL